MSTRLVTFYLFKEMEKSYARFLLYSFFLTFFITAVTVHIEDSKSAVQLLSIIFERQVSIFIISIIWPIGHLIGISIYNGIFKRKKNECR